MGLNAKRNGGNNKNRVEQPQIESDVYPSYLVQLIDLGLQPQKAYQGKEKAPVQEIMLTYELSDCFMVDENGDELEDKPRWASETLPFYGLFADKAKSTKRYYAFDPDESFEGDFAQAVGMACNVTIVNNESNGKVYANIGNVATISAKKAEKMNPIKNPTKVFDLEEPDLEVFNSLPEWIRDKIKGNLNFQGSPLQALLGKGGEAKPKQEEKQKPKPRAADPDDSEEDDNNPY
jgi:hypothetical protein